MKTTSTITNKNIYNLTSLWEEASKYYEGNIATTNYKSSIIKNSEWPNRVWLKDDFKENGISIVKTYISSINNRLTIPVWNNDLFQKFESSGFSFKFQQIGMSLNLERSIYYDSSITLKRVTNLKEAKIWSSLFKDAFGYMIHQQTIINSIKNITYYLAQENNDFIGTAITYSTKNVLGIHGVGIPPKFRRKGFANKIMQTIINEAKRNEYKHLTLQASDMGKGLYLKLGFQEDFIIRNYQLE